MQHGVLLRVKTRIYRAAALLSASPQLTDLDPSVADWFREEGLSEPIEGGDVAPTVQEGAQAVIKK